MTIYTQSDLDALEGAVLRKSRSVTFSDGRTVQFHSMEEIQKRIEYVRRQIEDTEGRQKLYAKFSKGLSC